MAGKDDQEVCYCFHVSARKIENFCRVRQPVHASQISECLSAGTGCGWCIPLLKKMHQKICGDKKPWWREDAAPSAQPTSADEFSSPEQYAAARQAYLQLKKQAASHDRPATPCSSSDAGKRQP